MSKEDQAPFLRTAMRKYIKSLSIVIGNWLVFKPKTFETCRKLYLLVSMLRTLSTTDTQDVAEARKTAKNDWKEEGRSGQEKRMGKVYDFMSKSTTRPSLFFQRLKVEKTLPPPLPEIVREPELEGGSVLTVTRIARRWSHA